MDDFGIDPDGPLPGEDDDLGLEIPEISNPLSDADFLVMQQRVPPLQHDQGFGIDVYLSACSFVNARV